MLKLKEGGGGHEHADHIEVPKEEIETKQFLKKNEGSNLMT